ncbi:hypothetical protein [Streptomyces sp. NPDC047061]|uniref:hypothetical protein n=1 Tax=Streptomyces sp. NPDC047061 TaxID=3154605 RepID=UPI0033D0AE0F
MSDYGPLARTVLAFDATVRQLVLKARESGVTAADWSALTAFVDVAEFRRVGTWMEVMDWREYTEFMTKWASASMGFETAVRRVSELPGLVYYEIEERHTRPGGLAVVNSLSVYGFDADARIRRLDVYLQQPRS